jgi:hypothetical protein
MNLLRKGGYKVGVVERWLPQVKQRKDLFGWCDLVAIRADKIGVLGVQVTSSSNMAARLTKMVAIPELLVWLRAGNRAEVHGWVKRKNGRWECRRRSVTLRDLTGHGGPPEPGVGHVGGGA